MRLIFTALACLISVTAFGQNPLYIHDIDLIKGDISVTEYLKIAFDMGFEIWDVDGAAVDNSTICIPNHPDNFIYLRKEREGMSEDGAMTFSMGFEDKVIHLDNLENLGQLNSTTRVWKIFTCINYFTHSLPVMYQINPYASMKKDDITNFFGHVSNKLHKSLKKKKYNQLSQDVQLEETLGASIFNWEFPLATNYIFQHKKSNHLISATESQRFKEDKGEGGTGEYWCMYYFELFDNSIKPKIEKEIKKWDEKNSNESNFIIGGIDIRDIDIYNLESMIRMFIFDCVDHGFLMDINIDPEIDATFESLSDNKIAVSYGMNMDDKIIIKVDPTQWDQASVQKKWYILYHELGHDVFNFQHGEGGKMMFCFADRDYTGSNFFDDKEAMFTVKELGW